jgi:hypothetical protein
MVVAVVGTGVVVVVVAAIVSRGFVVRALGDIEEGAWEYYS